ncbi:MAG: hypothetical protein QM676_03840 [Novosphingobium sp.]
MNRDLYLAILAMDSYNRGYGAGINLPETNRIGNATIGIDSSIFLDSNDNRRDIPASFYAIAYDMTGVAGFVTGEKVISYRGTDDVGSLSSLFSDGDIVNGWLIGGGSPIETQARLAVEFYNALVAEGADPRSAQVTLTGHSLGAGLAGYVASLYGKSAHAFDHMPYAEAATNAYESSLLLDFLGLKESIYGSETPWATNGTGIVSTSVAGEVLTALRFPQTSGTTLDTFGVGSSYQTLSKRSRNAVSLPRPKRLSHRPCLRWRLHRSAGSADRALAPTARPAASPGRRHHHRNSAVFVMVAARHSADAGLSRARDGRQNTRRTD